MTGRLRVPEKRAEHPRAGNPFPEGIWLLELEDVREKIMDPAANPKLQWAFTPNAKGNQAYKGKTASVLGIQFGKAQPIEDNQEDPGEKKVFVDITTRDGDAYIDQISEKADHVGYQILVDGALFTNLALALGQAYKQDGYVYPSDDFRAQLEAGAFKGVKVVAKVRHRHYVKRDKTAGLEVEVEEFSPAS